MGVKFFFHWLKKNYRNCIEFFSINSPIQKNIDNFCIDLNGVFHNCTQKIYGYGQKQKKLKYLLKRKRKKTNSLKTQLKVFKEVCDQITFLTELVKPNKRLILCVDGVAGSAKLQQQRQRRFKSAKSREESEDTIEFDSCSITPGTKFMHYLTKYIDWYIRQQVSTWRGLEIIFSNEKAPSEGEHKIINFIRYYGEKNETYCIHGLDADLIMLSLGTHVPKFYVLREDMYEANKFIYINIGKFSQKLKYDLCWQGQNYNKIFAINDFIFMCFMVGNDFLPNIPSLEIIEGGIETLISTYRTVCKDYGHLTKQTRDKSIIFVKDALQTFLGTISQDEKIMLENKWNKKDNLFPDPFLEKFMDMDGNGKITIRFEEYKKAYYQEKFPDISIKDICHKYLEGLQWVLSYYTRGIPNWMWYYSLHYAPFASDLAKHIQTFNFPKYGRTMPITPFQQLLSVLPPQSSNLIPKPLNTLLSEESPLISYYPREFPIDLCGKRKEWEGVAILPMVDFRKLRKEYFSIIEEVSQEDLKRNITGKTFLYKYSHETNYYFNSYYGDLSICKAQVETMEL